MKEIIAALERAVKAMKAFPWPSIVLINMAVTIYVVLWLRQEITERKAKDAQLIETQAKTIKALDEAGKAKDDLYQERESHAFRRQGEPDEGQSSHR